MIKEGREPYMKGDEIKGDGRFSDVHEIGNNPNYVAKEVNLSFENAIEYKERLERFEKNYKFFKEKFASYIPDFQLVYGAGQIGYNSKAKIPLILMEKVHEAERIESKDVNEYLNELDEFLEHVINIYLETYNNGEGWYGNEGFTPDIVKPSNYVYGKTNNDEGPKLYFVDLYPSFYKSKGQFKDAISAIIKSANFNKGRRINNENYQISDEEISNGLFPKTIEAIKKLEELP